jgi:hypothetical protein
MISDVKERAFRLDGPQGDEFELILRFIRNRTSYKSDMWYRSLHHRSEISDLGWDSQLGL